MYSIYAENTCIYNDISPLESVKLISPKLTLEDNAAGSLTMTVPTSNVGYSLIERMKTDITVYKNDTEIWAGRVLTEDNDFWNNRILYCEGELAFFNDSTQPQAEYHDMTVRGFLQTLIDIHNAKVSANRQFTLGAVTVTDSNDSLYRYTNYENTLECINEKLIDKLGGHIRIRKDRGVRYLDYLADYPNVNTQAIEFGKNLMDFTKKWDMSEFATVILPLGNRLEENDIEALDAYLTVESVNNGSKYVASASAVETYGWIEKVVHWDNVSTASALLSKAQRYLSEIQFDEMVIELKALDMHYLNVNAEAIKMLDEVKVVSRPHGMDRYFPVKKMEIPLDKPEDTLFTLGDKIRTSLTSVNNKTNADILKRINELPTRSQMLEEAKANATAIMRMATRGYITIVEDSQGSEALYASNVRITDPEHIPSNAKFWKLFANGLGYSSDGGQTFGLALTMDGAIVADYITAGTLNGEIIRAGTVKAAAISQEFKTSIANDIDALRQEFTAADGILRSSISAKVDGINGTTNFNTLLYQNYEQFIFGFNNDSTNIQLSTSGIGLYSGTIDTSNKLIELNGNGMNVWRTGVKIGNIGTNSWEERPNYRGLVFDLEYEGGYMTWARKISADADAYTTAFTYARAENGLFDNEGLYLSCALYARGYEINSPNLTNVRANGYGTYTNQRTFVTGVNVDTDGKVTSVDTVTCNIVNGMFVN